MWQCVSCQFCMLYNLSPHTCSSFLCMCNISTVSSRFHNYATPYWCLCQGCCMAWADSWIMMFLETNQSHNTGNQLHTFATQLPRRAKTYHLNSWKWPWFSLLKYFQVLMSVKLLLTNIITAKININRIWGKCAWEESGTPQMRHGGLQSWHSLLWPQYKTFFDPMLANLPSYPGAKSDDWLAPYS